MVNKENLANIIRRLAGRETLRLYNRDTYDYSCYMESGTLNDKRLMIGTDSFDMTLFEVFFTKKIKRRITLREVFPSIKEEYFASLGFFIQPNIDAFCKSIPDDVIIQRVEFIHRHNIVSKQGMYARHVKIWDHDIYVDLQSCGLNKVVIDKNSINISEINRDTKTYNRQPFFIYGDCGENIDTKQTRSKAMYF